jgi:hypothetical protein
MTIGVVLPKPGTNALTPGLLYGSAFRVAYFVNSLKACVH